MPNLTARITLLSGAILKAVAVAATLVITLVIVGGTADLQAQGSTNAPDASLATPEQLSNALRRGLYPQVLKAAQLVLEQDPKAPIHGMIAVALAAGENFEPAKELLQNAQAGMETNSHLYSLLVEAMWERREQNLVASRASCLKEIGRAH